MKAVILAGGFGKRLRPYTDEIPKPLIKVGGKPIIEYQVEWLRRQGIDRFLFLVGYKRDKIMEYFGDGSRFNISIEYSIEEEPLGTGGAIKNAEKYLADEEMFLVVNGDILTDLRILALYNELSGDVIGVLALVPLPSSFGVIEVDRYNYILEFREKPTLSEYWINAGVYLFKREILNHLPHKGDIERTTFPQLARDRRLKGVKYQGVFWRSIDTFKDIEYIEKIRGRFGEKFIL